MAAVQPSRALSRPTLRPGGAVAWTLWAIAAAFYFAEFFLRVAPGAMAGQVQKELHLSAAAFGTAMGLYYLLYAPIQLIVGVLLDRFGPRFILPLAAGGCAVGAFMMAGAHSETMLSLSRMLAGAGSAFAFVGAVYVATLWFPSGRLGMISGITTSLGTVGAIVGTAPVVWIDSEVGWRGTFIGTGVGVLVIGVVILLVMPGARRTHAARARGGKSPGIWDGLSEVVRSRRTWLIAIISFLLYAPLSAYGALWGPSYVSVALETVSSSTAAWMVSMLFVGMMIGGPILGVWSDRIGVRKPFLLVGAIGSLLSMIALIQLPALGVTGGFVVTFLLGFFTSSQVITFAAVMDLHPTSARAVAIAFTNFIVMLSGFTMQPLIGDMLSLESPHRMIGRGATYSVGDYQEAMISLPIALSVAVVLCLCLRTRRMGTSATEAVT